MENKISCSPPEKPFILRKREAEISIGNAINAAISAYNLPLFEVEDIVCKYLADIQKGAEKERKSAEETYKRQLAEYQKQKYEKEDVANASGDC